MSSSMFLVGNQTITCYTSSCTRRVVHNNGARTSVRHHINHNTRIISRQRPAKGLQHCRAAGFGSSDNPSPSTSSSSNASKNPKGSQQTEFQVKLPDSREDAIAQAAAALAYKLKGGSSSASRKKSKFALGLETEQKLSIEVPVMDTSTKAAAELAQEVVAALPADLSRQFTIVSCGKSSLQPSGGQAKVVSLEDLESIEALIADWRGPAAVLLNPEWAPEVSEETLTTSLSSNLVAFVKSFDTVYCFYPIAIKAFVVTAQEGVVFRQVGVEAGAAPWRIFLQEKNTFTPVGRMARRPSSIEIEVCFSNASAATSPLTQGAKFLKNLVSKKE